MYGLQGLIKENIPTSTFETIHSSCPNKTSITHSTRSDKCSNNQQNSYAPTNIAQESPINQSYQQTIDIQELRNMMKSRFEQMGTMLNLLTTVLTKL
jgi:hypothetical protein